MVWVGERQRWVTRSKAIERADAKEAQGMQGQAQIGVQGRECLEWRREGGCMVVGWEKGKQGMVVVGPREEGGEEWSVLGWKGYVGEQEGGNGNVRGKRKEGLDELREV